MEDSEKNSEFYSCSIYTGKSNKHESHSAPPKTPSLDQSVPQIGEPWRKSMA